MHLPFHLGLRNDGHVVSVIRQNGRTRECLGVAYPPESDPRRRILRQWGIDARSPRLADPDTIDLPLARRAQTILSYRLNPDLRQRLDSGMGAPFASRRESQSGLHGRAHLGANRPLVSARPHGFRSIESPARHRSLSPFGRPRPR